MQNSNPSFGRRIRFLFAQEATTRRKVALLAIVSILLFLLAFLLGGNYGLINMIELRREKRELKAQLRAVQAERDSLVRDITRLQNDKSAIERIAREKYGMARPNEKVIKFVDPLPLEKGGGK